MAKGILTKSAEKKHVSRNPEQARLRSETVREAVVRINANIPKSLHHQFKLKCIHEQRDMTQVLTELISRYVEGK
jgi:hypothetical protein